MQFCKKLDEILAGQRHINRKLDRIMALVSIEQGDLDQFASTLSTIGDDLAAIIAAGNLQPADESALQAAVAKVQALDVPAAPTT
jgi:hypothetical protein